MASRSFSSMMRLFLCAQTLVAVETFTTERHRLTKVDPLTKRPAVVDPSGLTHNDPSLVLHHAETVLNTLYAQTTATLSTGVAQGHSNPWFGPPDQYLEAGKSIAPPAANLVKMGLPSAQEMSQMLPAKAQASAADGWNVLDASRITEERLLPGFSPTRGILPNRDPSAIPPYTSKNFESVVIWSSKYLNVVDKLPDAAFAYAFIEFLFLRPNIDLYKSEIENESGTTLWAEFAATVGVRLLAMSVIAAVTFVIFD